MRERFSDLALSASLAMGTFAGLTAHGTLAESPKDAVQACADTLPDATSLGHVTLPCVQYLDSEPEKNNPFQVAHVLDTDQPLQVDGKTVYWLPSKQDFLNNTTVIEKTSRDETTNIILSVIVGGIAAWFTYAGLTLSDDKAKQMARDVRTLGCDNKAQI